MLLFLAWLQLKMQKCINSCTVCVWLHLVTEELLNRYSRGVPLKKFVDVLVTMCNISGSNVKTCLHNVLECNLLNISG
jgi:hypothetical protein